MAASASIIAWLPSTCSPRRPGAVETMWSAIATLRAGLCTVRPCARSAEKACGLERSCSRCRSMWIRLRPSGRSATWWLSHRRSNRVRGGALAAPDGVDGVDGVILPPWCTRMKFSSWQYVSGKPVCSTVLTP
ncbi:Uncharacterised protein [Bordetella pertussis]|nr:Uncharacterised protein [Bordetella pertussis]